MENQAQSSFDIIISGGSLSGCLMALSLCDARNNAGELLRIAIVEPNPVLLEKAQEQATSPNAQFDQRVLALSHHSAQYLKSLGAWDNIAQHAQAINTIHISDRGYYGKARIEAKNHKVKALGYVVAMANIGQSLLTGLKNKTNISWFSPNSIESITWQQEHVEVNLAADTEQAITLSAQLLIGCDGANSVCRRLANITSNETTYAQTALIANVSTTLPHNNVAFERFTEFGPIAMLPLVDNNSHSSDSQQCSLVWTLPNEQAQAYAQLPAHEFNRALENAFGSWLGGITQVSSRTIYPLKLVQANEQVFHRLALVGNASHTLHPIAGQGFNLGLRDVEVLSNKIKQALLQGNDFAQFSLLSQYASERSSDHQQTIGLTDSLVTLFSNTLPPLVAGRNIGLKVFNYLTPLKKALVNKTMGY